MGPMIGTGVMPRGRPETCALERVFVPEGLVIGVEPADLEQPLRPVGTIKGTRVASKVAVEAPTEADAVEDAIETELADAIGLARAVAPPRTPELAELGRSPRSLVTGASERLWRARLALVDFEHPKGEGQSLTLRLVSPFDDVAVIVWTTSPSTKRDGTPGEPVTTAKAWCHAAGQTRPMSVPDAKRWILGPWPEREGGGMTDVTGPVERVFVPRWQREKRDQAKRLASLTYCQGCLAPVLEGADQLDDVGARAAVDAEALAGPGDGSPCALLAEVACYLGGRDVYTLFPAPGGDELHRREDWHLGERRWPTHVAHVCNQPIPGGDR